MNENVENNAESTKLGGITGKGFMPGISGNPGGRPKDTLKAFVARELRDMSDDEKREWLKEHKITGIDIWKMGEGNPENKTDVTTLGKEINTIDPTNPRVLELIDELRKTNQGE